MRRLDYVLWAKKDITKITIKNKLLIWSHLAVQKYDILLHS